MIDIIIFLAFAFFAGWFSRGRYDGINSHEWAMLDEYRLNGMVCGVNPATGLPSSVAPANVIVPLSERRIFVPDYQRQR